MPKVSWLIPIYNAAPYLEASLRSVQAQTFSDFEAVIVDDGSSDGSSAALRAFCDTDTRFHYHHQANRGIIEALNVGLGLCRGTYLARMDGDDICEPQRLAEQVAYMDTHPACVAAGSRVTVIDETGRMIRRSAGSRHQAAGPTGFPRRRISLTHPTVIGRTAAFRDAGGYRAAFPAAEDYDLWLRLQHLGDMVELPAYLLRYRVHAGSVSGTRILLQRLSCLKAEIADFLSAASLDDGDLQTILNAATPDDLCRIAGESGRGLPDAAVLKLYFLSAYLRRATYRLPRRDARHAAFETSRQALKLIGAARSPAVRHFLAEASRELLRWAAATTTGRSRQG